MRETLINLVNKAKVEYANDVTDHTETEYIVECLLNEGVEITKDCKKCEYFNLHESQYPCKVCKNCYLYKFKAKESQ